MTDTNERTRREAEARLLEVLLVERHGGRGHVLGDEVGDAAGAGAASADGAPGRAPSPRGRVLLAAAALLLGLVVVVATRLSLDRGAGAGEAQDPVRDAAPPRFVEAADVATFLRHLERARELCVTRVVAIGAYRIVDEDGVGSQLDLAPWPEVHRVTGDASVAWRSALRASCERRADGGGVERPFWLDLVLDDDTRQRCFVSWSETAARLWIADGVAIEPDDRLRALFDAAAAELAERHARAGGRVDTAAELGALPLETTRLDVPSDLLVPLTELPVGQTVARLTVRGPLAPAHRDALARLGGLRELELRDCVLADADLDAVAGLTWLRALSLRSCEGLDARLASRLPALRRLERLHLADVPLFDERALSLDVLASLPMLREFGVRIEAATPPERWLAPLARTKLERLVLADVGRNTPLTALADLPTLRELVLVGGLDDDDVARLGALRSLRHLTLRNDGASEDALDDLRAAVPGLRVDWRPGGYWFDPARALDHASPVR